MPLKKSSAMRAAGLAAAVCGSIALTPAAAMAADSPNECEARQTYKIFALLGDQNQYFTADGGLFEGSLSWKATGAAKVKPSNFALVGKQVAGIDAGGSLESGDLCVDVTRRHLRFAVKGPASGLLNVEAVNDDGSVEPLGAVDGAAQRNEKRIMGWSVSPEIGLATSLGVTSGSTTVKLRFTAVSGNWDIDSIQIDPFRS
jgi:hypothetical protein